VPCRTEYPGPNRARACSPRALSPAVRPVSPPRQLAPRLPPAQQLGSEKVAAAQLGLRTRILHPGHPHAWLSVRSATPWLPQEEVATRSLAQPVLRPTVLRVLSAAVAHRSASGGPRLAGVLTSVVDARVLLHDMELSPAGNVECVRASHSPCVLDGPCLSCSLGDYAPRAVASPVRGANLVGAVGSVRTYHVGRWVAGNWRGAPGNALHQRRLLCRAVNPRLEMNPGCETGIRHVNAESVKCRCVYIWGGVSGSAVQARPLNTPFPERA